MAASCIGSAGKRSLNITVTAPCVKHAKLLDALSSNCMKANGVLTGCLMITRVRMPTIFSACKPGKAGHFCAAHVMNPEQPTLACRFVKYIG